MTVPLIFKMFHNVAGVPKNCKLNNFFPFFHFFSGRIMYIEMLHVFQRVESIHKTKAGFSLE